MRLAIYDQQLNLGGGVRFITRLILAIKKINPKIEIVFFCNKSKLKELLILELLEKNGIKVVQLQNIKKSNLDRLIEISFRKIGFKLTDTYYYKKLLTEIKNKSKDFDLAYFPWPFLIPNVEVHCPKLATFHDFNFKYFFGMPIFNKIQTESLNFNIKRWLSDSIPIVSSNFMKSELQKFYPEITKVEVVHLASLNLFQDIPICVSNFAKYDFLNDKPFIICSAHICFHKNIGNIIAAASILNKEFVRVRFVFTGGSTEILSGRSAYLGLDTEYNGEFDIFGLGYIPDIDMDFLLKKAFAVLNASFYEAGNGIGFDAWPLGIPVIQSNIPSFQEHLDLQGFKAFTFDPRNPHDLVESILKCLENETLRNEYINASLIASKNLSWDITAEKYLSIFEKTLKN